MALLAALRVVPLVRYTIINLSPSSSGKECNKEREVVPSLYFFFSDPFWIEVLGVVEILDLFFLENKKPDHRVKTVTGLFSFPLPEERRT
jgi:hypothetical protein